MCESHTHGNTGNQTPVNNLNSNNQLWTAKNELQNTLTGYTEKFLNNKDQLNHFNKLRTPADKLSYINGIITSHYSTLMTAASGNVKEIQRLQGEMNWYITMITNDLFGGGNPPAKA